MPYNHSNHVKRNSIVNCTKLSQWSKRIRKYNLHTDNVRGDVYDGPLIPTVVMLSILR